MTYRFLSLFLIMLLAACSSAAPGDEAATLPPSTAATTVVDAPPAQAEAPATGQPAVVDAQSSAVVFGRNDDGTFFHGAPDAPVTFIDYSDFL
ncbi:MAG: hypothetical protein KIS95_13520 [Anaerolineae bacterium]|nr:hypothetical protein [Anaerolineales bacterium]MCB8934436.1 hypothetical protein [Promineifilum sp.]MCO5181719.1 hypothetical protein [Promineifilum sp.]MCW5848249.1 hypothetical protein [Anaerolineae bacterium]